MDPDRSSVSPWAVTMTTLALPCGAANVVTVGSGATRQSRITTLYPITRFQSVIPFIDPPGWGAQAFHSACSSSRSALAAGSQRRGSGCVGASVPPGGTTKPCCATDVAQAHGSRVGIWFASRQVLYERFFFGDPVRMAGALVTGHNVQIQQYADQVRAFVKQSRDEAFAAASG